MAYEDDEYEEEYEEPVETPAPEPEPVPPPEPEQQVASVDSGVRSDATAGPKETWEPWTPPETEPDYGFSDTGVPADARTATPTPPKDKPPEEPVTEPDYGYSDLGVPVGARTAAPAPPKETWEPWVEPEGPAATVGRSLAHQVVPTAAAIGAGVLAAPFGLVGAIPAGIAAYAATEYGQGKLLDKTGYGDDAQMEANRRANPKAAMVGDFGAAAIPWGVGKKLELGTRAIGAGIGGVIEGGSQIMRGELDLPRLGGAVGTGAVFNSPRAGTRAVEGAIAGGAARVTGRPDWYSPYTGYTPPPPPAGPPPGPTQPGVKNEDWTGPPQDVAAPPPPAQGEMPWGAQQQPGLPLEQPAPPRPGVSTQPEIPFAPPVTGPDGQLGFNVDAPPGRGIPQTTYRDGKWETETTSRQAMPAGAGTAREMAPPSTPRQEMEQRPYSTEVAGRAAVTRGDQPQAAAGINVLQPGQIDPTLAAPIQLTSRPSGPYGPEHPPQPPPQPPRTDFEPPRRQPPRSRIPYPPIPSSAVGPRGPVQPKAMIVRPPDSTQGTLPEPPVPAGQVRLFRTDPGSPVAFTTDRAVAERFGPLRHVDVSQAQLAQQFRQGRDPGSFVGHQIWATPAWQRKVQPTRPMATQPTQRRPPPPPAGGQPPGPPPPPTRGGPGAGGGRPPEPRMSSRPLDEQINAAVGRAVWHPEPPAAPARAPAPAPAPGPARPGAGAARYSREQANSMLNMPAKLRAEAARRGMPPDALKQELKDLDTAAREASFRAAPPPQRGIPKAPEKNLPAATPVDKTGTPPVDISVKGARERADAASQEKAAPKVDKPAASEHPATREFNEREAVIEGWAEQGGAKGSRNAKASEYVYLRDKLEKEGKLTDKEKLRRNKLYSELSDAHEEVKAAGKSDEPEDAEYAKAKAPIEDAKTPDEFIGAIEHAIKNKFYDADLAPTTSLKEFIAAAEKRGWTYGPYGKGKALWSPDGKHTMLIGVSVEGNSVQVQWGTPLEGVTPPGAKAEPPAAKAAKAVRAAKPKPASDEPRSLLKHIQKLGGIMPDDKGELAAAFGGRKSGLYLQLARSKEKGGLPLDRIVENIARGAPEERYLHEGADINDLLRALKGSREHFPMGEVPKETPVQAERAEVENAANAERVTDIEKSVDKYLADPDNSLEGFEDGMRQRMYDLIEEGKARDPADAYEKAVKEVDAQREFEGDIGEPKELAKSEKRARTEKYGIYLAEGDMHVVKDNQNLKDVAGPFNTREEAAKARDNLWEAANEPKELADIPDDVGKGRLPAEEPTPKPAAEKGADNKPQEVMFAKDEKTAAQRATDAPLRPKTSQKGSDFGMFADRQDDLMDMLSKPKDEPRDTPREFQSVSEAAEKGLGRGAPKETKPENDMEGMFGPKGAALVTKAQGGFKPKVVEKEPTGTPEQQQKAAGDKFSSELHKAEQAAEAAGKSKDDYIEFLSPEGKAALKEHTRLAEQNEEAAFNKNYEKLNDMLPEGFTATREKYIRLLGDDDWKAIEGDRQDRSFDIRDKNGEMVGSVDGVHLFDKDTKGGWFKELLDTGSAKPVHEKAMEAAREANNLPKGVVDLGFEKARPGLQKLADNLAAAGKKVPGKVAPFKSVADDAAARISEQNAKAKTAEVNRLQQKYFDAQKQLDSLEKNVKSGTLEDTDPKYLNARRAAEDAINAWHEAEGISIGKKRPEPLRSKVLERGRSGRPIRTTPLAIGKEEAILKAGYEKATGPKGEPREPSRQAAQREGPPGKVKAFDDDGKQTVFTGKTVAEAAAAAKRAGYRDYQIYNADMTKYRPPARAVAGHNNPPKTATATATAAPPAGGGKPPPAGAAPPAGGATPPPKGPAAAAAPPRKGRTADEEAILGRIANPESWTDKIPRTKEEANKAWRAYYTAAKNALDPIEQLTKLAGKAPKNPDKFEQFKQDIGWSPKARAVDFEKDPGVLARLTKGLGGRFQSQIGIRNPLTGKVTGGTYDINTGQRTGDPLEKVLTQVKQDPEGFAAYIIARRAADLHAEGKQTGMDIKAANGVVAAGGARWGPVSKELSAFKDRVLDNLTDVLGAKAVAAIKANNPNHIPFYRAIPPESELGRMVGAGLQTTKPIHEFKGSNEKIYHPLDTIPKNVMAFTDIAERNRVGRALEDLNNSLPADRKFMTEVRDNHPIKVSPEEVNRLLKKEGIPEEVIDGMTIFRPDFFKPTDTRIRIFRDGKAKVYEVSPEVGKAWNAMNQQDLHPIIKALSIPARTLRAGAVTNLEFILRNLTRDQITAAMQSPHGYIPYVDFAKGLGNIFVGSEKYHNWLRNGGANANLVSVDRRIINVDPKTLGEKAKNVIVSPFHALQLMSELVENATRLGVAMRAKGKGASWTEATFQSREATLDFQRVGSNMRAVNNLVAFFNARYEGVDRLARAFRDQPARAAFVALASVTVPSLALWYNNKDDPRIKEIERWEKDIYWLIPTTNWKNITPAVKDYADGLSSAWKRTLPNGTEQYNAGTIYRWPKPFAEGTFFGSIPERVLDAYYDHDPKAFEDLTKVVKKALNLEVSAITPQVAIPFIEQFANESLYFERPLMSEKLAKGSPEKQVNYSTSETAKYIGAAIRAAAGEKASGGSPIIVDNYIRAWTGGLGQYVVRGLSDNIIKAGEEAATGKKRPPAPDSVTADFTGVKAFVSRWPRSQTESIRQFYKERENRMMEKTDYDAMKKSDPDAADIRANQGGLSTGNSTAKILGAARRLVDEINNDKSMSPADKRMAIDLTWLTMIETAKEGLATFKEDKRDRNAK